MNFAYEPTGFDAFFELGQQETASPFLKPSSSHWGVNLTLKASIVAAIFLLLSFTFSFFPLLVPISHILLVTVYFLAGVPALIESIEDLFEFDINIDILMTLAAFSSILIGSGMEGALLLVLFALSGSMEDAVTSKAKGAISSLNKLSPTRACVIDPDGTLLERSINDVPLEALVLVRSGQIVPLDGLVVEGTSSVNLVHLTGENYPVTIKPGDTVAAGARNLEGALTLQVKRTSADSTLAKIIELVTQAQEARPRLQRWFDRLSNGYAITIILLSAFFAITLPFLLSIPFLGREGSLYRALAFLIAASPCALIIAIPIAYLSAISVCARKGILIKGGITMDAIAQCTAIAMDKTGTLTTGELTLEAIDSEEALSIAYALERNAVHPIAKAIVRVAEEKQLTAPQIQNFRSIPGSGLEGVVKDFPVAIGNSDFISSRLPLDQAKTLQKTAEAYKKEGFLVAALQIGSNTHLLLFRDTARPKIKETIDSLKKRNLRIVMLTGDHEANAKKVAQELNIQDYHADLTPEDKLDYISKLSQTEQLAMVGDGVNDAPALARATVGICMGKVGTTAAIDAADAVLLHDNIEALDWLFGKARQTRQIVQQNLSIAFSAILIASLPALAGIVPLWLAVIMHEGGTVLVGLNALRLLRK